MERGKKNLIIAIMLNALTVLFEILGLILSLRRRGVMAFLFYTELSNYFTLVISLLFVVFGIIALKNNRKIYNWILKLRYASTVCLIFTFMVVLCVLVPISPSEFGFYFFGDSNLYQHLFCPILTTVSFLCFERKGKLERKTILWGVFPTLFYGLVLISLNFCKIIVGPYPFFYVYDMPWYVIVLLLAGIFSLAFFISWLTKAIYNRGNKKLIREYKVI